MSINRNVVNHNGHLQFHVSQPTLRAFYQLILLANSLLIFATAASDLGFSFSKRTVFLHLDLKLEGNLAVWYSSTLLLLTGLAALAVAASTPIAGKNGRRHGTVWVILAAFFISLSADETAQLHEWAGRTFTTRFGDTPGLTQGAYPAFAWLIALSPLIICFLVGMKVAIQELRVNRLSRNFALAGVTCWIGVLLAEFIQAQLVRLSMQRSLQGVLEEGLEITGTAFFLASFLEYVRYAKSLGAVAPLLVQTETLSKY